MAYRNRRAEGVAAFHAELLTEILPHALLGSLRAMTSAAPPMPASVPAPPPASDEAVSLASAGAPSPGGARVPEPDAAAAEAALARARRDYTYAPKTETSPLGALAVAERFPFAADYDLSWALPYLRLYLGVGVHVAAARAWFFGQQLRGTFDLYRSYREVYFGERRPPDLIDTWHTDDDFGRYRVDGADPMTLQRVRARQELALVMPDFTDEMFARAMGGGPGLGEEIDAGRIYVLDYSLLAAAQRPRMLPRDLGVFAPARRDSRWRETYLAAPIAVFCERPGVLARSELVPVAIQLDQPDSEVVHQPPPWPTGGGGPQRVLRPPIVLRGEGARWDYAKTLVQSADQNLQVCSTHVGRTHWLAEAFALAVPRQLPPQHWLHLLLEPHVRYVLATNRRTLPLLTEPGRIFGDIYAGKLEETRAIMSETHRRWSFRDLRFDRDLARRGVEGLRYYPYRDDAAELWRATRGFVAKIAARQCPSDADVRSDRYVQGFYAELVDPARGNLRDVVEGDALDSVEKLIDLVAQYIFTAGPQHAAVHYPQRDYFGYVPASPGALWQPPPLRAEDATEELRAASLPPLKNALVQWHTDHIGDYRYDRFGDYSRYRLGRVAAFSDDIAWLQSELAAIEARIAARNRTRVRPYVYLLPSNIPNSITI